MINYSIVMRSVQRKPFGDQPGAKSRINQAEAGGVRNPEQKDLDLVKTEKQNAFAISQYTDVMTIEKFAKHITSHGSVYSRADISAILYMAVDCMREMLLEGKKIRLGDLGDFSRAARLPGREHGRQVYGAEHKPGEGCSGSLARSSRTCSTTPSSTSWLAAALRLPCSRPSRRARPTLTSTCLSTLMAATTATAEAMQEAPLLAAEAMQRRGTTGTRGRNHRF